MQYVVYIDILYINIKTEREMKADLFRRVHTTVLLYLQMHQDYIFSVHKCNL